MIGKHQLPSGRSLQFRKRKNRGQHRRCGMNQQPIDAIFGSGQLCVIEVIGMNGNAIRECSETGRDSHAASQDPCAGLLETKVLQILQNKCSAFGHGPGKRQT